MEMNYFMMGGDSYIYGLYQPVETPTYIYNSLPKLKDHIETMTTRAPLS